MMVSFTVIYQKMNGLAYKLLESLAINNYFCQKFMSIYFAQRNNKVLENLIPFESLPEQYQLSKAVLWDCLLALKCEPQKLDEQIYFTTSNLKRLEQFIKRIEISWDCPYILETCYQAAKKSSSSFIL